MQRRCILRTIHRVVATTQATPGKGNVSVVRITVIASRSVGHLSRRLIVVSNRANLGFFLHSTSGVLRTRTVVVTNAHRRIRNLGYTRYKFPAYIRGPRTIPYTVGSISLNVTINSTYTATSSLHLSAHIVFDTNVTTRHLKVLNSYGYIVTVPMDTSSGGPFFSQGPGARWIVVGFSGGLRLQCCFGSGSGCVSTVVGRHSRGRMLSLIQALTSVLSVGVAICYRSFTRRRNFHRV